MENLVVWLEVQVKNQILQCIVGRNDCFSCSFRFCPIMVVYRAHDENALNLSNFSHFTPNCGLGEGWLLSCWFFNTVIFLILGWMFFK